MHILLLNWRDIRHPKMGGAERLTHGILRRLVIGGHRVSWFSSSFQGAPEHEAIDGMNVLNFKGGPATRALALTNWTRLGTIERNQSKMLERILRGTLHQVSIYDHRQRIRSLPRH